MHEMIGKTYSHYTLLEKLGEGGMGVVYKAEDTRLDRIVALKFFSAELTGGQSDRARILQEAKAAAALNHPNVCAVIDVVEADDQQFIVMEYVDGKPLRIKRGSVSYAEAVNTGIHMARALAHAHRRGVIHRDIKMENIMMTREDEVKIMDFGLAMLQGKSSWSSPGAVLGTAAYMSPEQTRGEEVDHRTDLFSFGVVMF